MNLANRKFRDNKTGQIIKVIDSFENIAVLENRDKVDVRRLMDSNLYTEQIDPNDFFNTKSTYNSILDRIKNIPTDNLTDNEKITESYSNVNDNYKPQTNESVIVEVDEDYEKAELARKYGIVDNREATIKQQEAFAKLLGDEEELPAPPPQPIYQTPKDETIQRIEIDRDGDGTPIQKPIAKPEDPIHVMFRNAKKSIDFTLDLTLNNKIPRLDFIEMMEDSYERSIIDFLAGEIANDLLKNPENLKFQISEKIKQMVYNNKKTTPVKKPVAKKPTTRKPSVKKNTTDKLKDDLKSIKETVRKKEVEEQ